MTRWHVVARLNRTAADAHSLALLAMLQPDLPLLRPNYALWSLARSKLTPTSPPALSAVLALPLEEALRALDLGLPTDSPIAVIAEQINLVHLNDLYSRLFIRLVDVTTTNGAPPTSIKSLVANLESKHLGSTLRSSSFDREIRGVIEGTPRQSASHALGLVLIGLWGILTGPRHPASQAALASSLAAAEFAGHPLTSISSMLELLYPGSSSRCQPTTPLAPNAASLDALACVCINYIALLLTPTTVSGETRLQRLEASRGVQSATARLRLDLTRTGFVGLASDDGEVESVEGAKERLVGVLSVVGRRASGRMSGRDEDSGLEGDLDEL